MDRRHRHLSADGATFSVRVRTPRPPDDALRRLLDVDAHTAAVPLTVVTGSMTAPGDTFVARTTLGPIAFDDPMVVRAVTRDATATEVVIVKTGRLVRGDIRATVRQDGDGAVVEWAQRIAVGALPRALDPVVAVAARVAYAAALRRILA